MKHTLVSLLALLLAACSGDSGTREPDPPPATSPPASEPPPAGEQPPVAQEPDDSPGAPEGPPCVKSGCSGTLCVEQGDEVVTTCEWKPEYECYQSATCERQPDGSCDFSEAEEIQQCVASKRTR